MKKFKNISLAFLIMFTIIIVGVCGFYNFMLTPVNNKEDIVEIEIPNNTSTKQIAKILKDNQLIRDDKIFLIYVRIFKVDNMKAGYYDLSRDMGVKKIVEALQTGSKKNPNEIQITFQEGINIREIATIISNHTNNSYDDVIAKTTDTTYLDTLIEKYWFITDEVKNSELYYGLEGYLYPDTYRFENKDVSIEIIFNKMLDEMNDVLSTYKEDIEKSDLTLHQILSLASMVEKEAAKESDRGKVASVFINRMKKGMSLGSDVTTRYACKIDNKKQALTAMQYKIASPYNTRLTDGSMNGKLPIGPICAVSKESIVASIYPEDTDYLYFIANIQTLETFFYNNASSFEQKKAELKSVNGGF